MLAVQIRELLQNSLLKVIQRLPHHSGASRITPCPSPSVCLCCRSAGLEHPQAQRWPRGQQSPSAVQEGDMGGLLCAGPEEQL